MYRNMAELEAETQSSRTVQVRDEKSPAMLEVERR